MHIPPTLAYIFESSTTMHNRNLCNLCTISSYLSRHLEMPESVAKLCKINQCFEINLGFQNNATTLYANTNKCPP